ncbi:hypothetical protein GALMADRAFT_137316 [Galerina marginata CBS 339.88]|uniref:Uncharacterized protein n=1 Tax=Galerina marginata (strain CBS 339.88) TaxID=685588 RepID=A0A067T8J5_GALM3|nr:hypothetical protein GALMADRAFT_137316 [Galerina marginata CBS 339.88]
MQLGNGQLRAYYSHHLSCSRVIEENSAVSAFAVALIVMGFRTGLFKANISPLVAEQYKRTRLFVITQKNGERVIVDPALTVSRVYMYFYPIINIGALVGQISMSYSEKFVGFYLAYTLPTAVFLLCRILLWIGRNKYVTAPPSGYVLTQLCGSREVDLELGRHVQELYSPWLLGCRNAEQASRRKAYVDVLRRSMGLMCNQHNSNLASQAGETSTHGIPNDVLSNLDPFALLIFIPVCDLMFYPALRRMGINFSALKKITAGFRLRRNVVQHYVYKTSLCGYDAGACEAPNVSPLNVWVQTRAEIVAIITGLEYAFTKAPGNMRSLVMSILFTYALSAALGDALFATLSADPLLVWSYAVKAVLAFVTRGLFWWSVRDLDAKEDALNNMKEGHLDILHSDKHQ